MLQLRRSATARTVYFTAALLLGLSFIPYLSSAATLGEIIEGAKKEGNLRGQWGQNSFGGSEGFQEILAGMNKKYKLNLKGQYTPGPDMQRLMLRVIQEAAAGQPASTDVYLGNSQAIFDGLKANLFTNMTFDKFIENKPKPEGKFKPSRRRAPTSRSRPPWWGFNTPRVWSRATTSRAGWPTCSTPNGRARSRQRPTPPASGNSPRRTFWAARR